MNSIKGQMSIFDFPECIPETLCPAEEYYNDTGRTDYWQVAEGKPYKFWKSKEVNIRGICDDGYCPDCNAALDDLISECPFCGLSLTWESWKKLNKEWVK